MGRYGAGGLQPHVQAPLLPGGTHTHFLWLWAEEITQLSLPFLFFFFYWVIFQPGQHKQNKREVGAQAGLAVMLFSADTPVSPS